ncbi:MAG: hypothetical protein WCA07_11525 [Gloeobacterales cyanobacterium]
MMKYALVLALVLLGFFSESIYSHELAADKNVGALMHIEPNDDPKVGVSSKIWFDLVKKGGQQISLADCDCVFSLYKGTARIPLVTPTLTESKAEETKSVLSAQVTFPERGAYRLVLSGKPKGKNSFNPFTLRWAVRASE